MKNSTCGIIETLRDKIFEKGEQAIANDNKKEKIIMNNDIRAKEVRLITQDRENKGIVPTSEALSMADDAGLDLSWLYDVDNILDTKKKQIQEDWLDNTSIERIAEVIDKRITDIKIKYAEINDDEYSNAGDDILELIENLQKNPESGYPLFRPIY